MKLTNVSKRISFIVCALVLALNSGSSVATIVLYDWVFNVDGTISEKFALDAMPTTGSLDSSGLGMLSMSFTDVGDHSFISYFDYEIDEVFNTFYNEYGDVSGSLAAGQSWEIDEPGFLFGDIYYNVLDGNLDNFNNVPYGLEDDVSFAMGWDFSLAAGETAVVDLFLSDTLDTSGFYLSHMDNYSSDTIYFWSTLSVSGITSVPEPGVLFLMSIGLIGLAVVSRNKKQ